MANSTARPSIGELIGGKYRIEREIGAGGMGVVYEATNVRMKTRVAIKMLLPEHIASAELVARFEREARAAGQLQHRNAARIIDVDVSESGAPYMVMELLHGHDLQAELDARRRLGVADATRWAIQACDAMSEAHARGVVHRDLKPSNLFLNEEPDGTVLIKVLDFGISKIQTDDGRVTATQTQMGTPLYMSPEQVRSAKLVDHRTDIWSLGVILYELLAGEPPFTGSPAGVGAAIVADTPRRLRELAPEVPEGLEAVVMKAMAKDPGKRFASMGELAAALAPFAGAQSSSMSRLVTASNKGPTALAMAATLPASVAFENKPASGRTALVVAASIAALAAVAVTVAWRAGVFESARAKPQTSSSAAASSTPAVPEIAAASANAGLAADSTRASAERLAPLPSARVTRPRPSSTTTSTSAPTATAGNPARL